MAMVVLIADKFESTGVDALRRGGCEVVIDPSLKAVALREAIVKTKCRVLVVRSTRVTAEMLGAGATLGLVVRAGAGVNTIDIAAAARQAILVANCPGKNAIAVAELAFALILGLDRRLCENVTDLRAGRWNKKEYAHARGLKGRTLGVVGLGTIGEAVARRGQAFGMKVAAWSRSLTAERAEELGVLRCHDAADVASRCDVLTVHLAATPETKQIINAGVFERLRPGSYFINTARSEVVDYDALAEAIRGKQLRVGLDVFPHEPAESEGSFADPILDAGGIVYGTHHIGASTDQAQDAIASETVRIVLHYLNTGRVENCVNLCARSPARYVVVVRHRNRPGVLAHALSAISDAGVNVEEMENVICEGTEGACAQIKLDSPLDQQVIRRIERGHEHVLSVSFFEVG